MYKITLRQLRINQMKKLSVSTLISKLTTYTPHLSSNCLSISNRIDSFIYRYIRSLNVMLGSKHDSTLERWCGQ